MPAMLGKEFYEKKKLPVPVCVGNKRRFARSVAAAVRQIRDHAGKVCRAVRGLDAEDSRRRDDGDLRRDAGDQCVLLRNA